MTLIRMAVPCLAALAATAHAEADLRGMWSDPPTTTADTLCMFACADWAVERLNALLDNPANDARPTIELLLAVDQQYHEQFVVPRLTPAGLATVNRDPADDPSFLYCEPPGLARQIFTPHQLEIAASADRIEMRYGEWDARRTVWMDGRSKPAGEPPTRMGFSVGRYDGDTLVIETTGIAPNLAPWYGRHGEQLRMVERYARSADGTRLTLTATFEDPWALTEPLVYKKVWGWAPEQEIFPYEDCERPTEVTRGAGLL